MKIPGMEKEAKKQFIAIGILLSALFIIGYFWGTSIAQTTPEYHPWSEVECVGCIEGSDISVGAITKDKFVLNSLTTIKFPTNSIGGSKFTDNSIQSVDIVDKSLLGNMLENPYPTDRCEIRSVQGAKATCRENEILVGGGCDCVSGCMASKSYPSLENGELRSYNCECVMVQESPTPQACHIAYNLFSFAICCLRV